MSELEQLLAERDALIEALRYWMPDESWFDADPQRKQFHSTWVRHVLWLSHIATSAKKETT